MPQGLLNQIQPTGDKKNPYATGLQTDFQNTQIYNPHQGQYMPRVIGSTAGPQSDDRDVRQAQDLTNQLGYESKYHTGGMDQAAAQSQLDMLRGRIGLKNALGESIAGNDANEGFAEKNVRDQSGESLRQGLKKTRDNYSARGLGYSGLREGGESSVKANVASQMAQGLAGTKQDYANAKSSAQNAYASVDLANQQDTLNRANMAFDTANQNSIARLQAMQQLGQGVGAAAGYVAGTWGGQNTLNQPQQLEGQPRSYTGSNNNGGGLMGYQPQRLEP